MRSFPSAQPRRAADRGPLQWLLAAPVGLVALVALVALVGLVSPVARADDDHGKLKHEQKQVQGRIDKVSDDLHESSRRLTRVTRQLSTSQSNLRAARRKLVRVHDRRIEAKRVNVRLGRQLKRAQARYRTAVADLRTAQAEVAEQRRTTRETVIGMATAGDPRLAMVTSYLDSGSVEELMINETGNGVVVGHQQNILTGLVAAEERFSDREQKVEDARDAVAEKKTAATKNLTRIRHLNVQAKNTRNRIARAVNRTRRARVAAVKARKRDQAALNRLKVREANIKRKILAASRGTGGNYSGATSGFLTAPASGPITSPYGWRTHPIYGYWGLHNGTDFGVACGSKLVAGASGTVVNEYYDQVYGNRLYLAIGKVNGAVITLVYNHLSSYAVGQGAKVARGDVVGYVGTTGWSTGCHLHFTVLKNGNPVDPANYL